MITIFSIGSTEKFYRRTQQILGNHEYLDFLENIRDLTVLNKDNQVFDEIELEPVFVQSFERSPFRTMLYNITVYVKNEANSKSDIDTYTFIQNLLEEYKDTRLSSELEKKLIDIVQRGINEKFTQGYFFTEPIVEYIKRFKLGNIYSEFLKKAREYYPDKLNLLKIINDALVEETTDKSKDIERSEEQVISKIYDIVEGIKNELLVKPDELNTDLKLGHYTSMGTLKCLINPEDSYLRLTNSRQLNDPMEGKALLKYLFNNKKIKKPNDLGFIQSYVYLASATTVNDSLPMWKQYAGDANGVFLEYDTNYLKDIIMEGYSQHFPAMITRVCYIDDSHGVVTIPGSEAKQSVINTYIEELKSELSHQKIIINNMIAALNPISLLFKNQEYSYENEYRIMLDLERDDPKLNKPEIEPGDSDTTVPFLYTFIKDIPLRYSCVTLGPKSIDIDYVGPYIKYCSEDLDIARSSIHYR